MMRRRKKEARMRNLLSELVEYTGRKEINENNR